eukprot:803044-Pelagomonas_calceolata.AAC.10
MALQPGALQAAHLMVRCGMAATSVAKGALMSKETVNLQLGALQAAHLMVHSGMAALPVTHGACALQAAHIAVRGVPAHHGSHVAVSHGGIHIVVCIGKHAIFVTYGAKQGMDLQPGAPQAAHLTVCGGTHVMLPLTDMLSV